MGVINSCCCFTNVRSGSVACGVYSLVLSLISAGIVAYNLHLYALMTTEVPGDSFSPSQIDSYNLLNGTFPISYIPVNGTTDYQLPIGNDNAHMQIHRVIFLCALVVAAFLFCSSFLLITGVLMDKHRLLMPWIIVMAVNIVLDTGTMTYHTTLIGSLKFIIIEMLIWLLLTVLNIYCLLCVFSQHQELKAGRGTREFVQRNRARVAYHPSIQQVHINQGPIIINGINGQMPQAVTSSVQTSRLPYNGAAHLTTTLLVSAPDYNIAASQLPQYHETTTNANSNKDPLLSSPEQTHTSAGSDSPPPPYSS